MHAIKNHFPFEFWNVIFFLDDKLQLSVMLHFVGQISRNSCIPIKWIYKAAEPNTIYIFNRHHHLVHQR